MQKILLPALCVGLLIAYVDSRPNWDDAGITAVVLFACGAVCGVLEPRRCWLWALAVGMWIPVLGIATSGNYGSLLVLVFSFAGAYAGMAARKVLSPPRESHAGPDDR